MAFNIKTATLRPNGMGNNDNWTENLGTKPDQINNTPPEDTRWLSAFTPNILDAYLMDPAPADLVECTAVKLRARLYVWADPGIEVRFRAKLYTIGPSVLIINRIIDLPNTAGPDPVEYDIGLERTGLSISKALVNGMRCHALSQQAPSGGWVLGNAVLGLFEYYLDITYNALQVPEGEIAITQDRSLSESIQLKQKADVKVTQDRDLSEPAKITRKAKTITRDRDLARAIQVTRGDS
jgi:hypothetical protein